MTGNNRLKMVVWIWKILKREVKKWKKCSLFKEGKQTTWLIEKIKITYILYVFYFYCNEIIVVSDIKKVHKVSFLNSIDYYIIVKNVRKILSRFWEFTKCTDHGETDR